MEREITFIVKEEILRNVLKTHNVILVLGWLGTGKTATCLRAAKGIWKTYYFNADAKYTGRELDIHTEGGTLLKNIDEMRDGPQADSLLIIDDFDAAPEETATAVKRLLSGRSFPGKIVITAQSRPKLDEEELSIDAVVRIKDETAEILYTSLRDLT
jgi:predicted AAA+ superfamily ATPase